PFDAAFHALSDPTRRAVVNRLARSPAPVKQPAAPFAMGLPAFLKHLRVLEASGLIATERTGRTASAGCGSSGWRRPSRGLPRGAPFGCRRRAGSRPMAKPECRASMTMTVENPELTISRLIAAPPATVCRAWSKAEHLARWWIPAPIECQVVKLDL